MADTNGSVGDIRIEPGTYRWLVWPRSFEDFQLLTLGVGIFWIGPRLYAALVSTSMGLLADAVQHLIEVIFSVFVYLSLRAASRSNALLFPHGTGKFESIANALLALAFLITGFGIVGAGLSRILNPVPMEGAGTGILFLAISLVINLGIWLGSAPLEKSGREIITFWRRIYVLDILMKGGTILCVYLSEFGGLFLYLDAIIAIVIGGSMVQLALKAVRSSIWELSDRAIEEEAQLAILRGLSEHFDAFDDFIDLRTRRSGGKPVIEVAIGFEASNSWADVLLKCEKIKAQIEAEIEGATVLVIPTSRSLFKPDVLGSP